MKQLIDDAKCYVDLRIKKAKLSIVEHLSAIVGRAVALVGFVVFLVIALFLLTGALVVVVAEWVDSLAWAFVIVGGFFLIISLVFLLLRDRLFVGGMVGMFSKMFFGNSRDEYDEDEEEDWHEKD